MDQKGTVISIHDIRYNVKVRPEGAKPCAPQDDKEIIHNVSGLFKAGMNAILGATGSGKTSLLDIMAGRKDPAGCSGQILVNGRKQPKNFKCMAGYVVQDDVVMGTLTVRENFMFSANLRLSNTISVEEKQRRVDETINELGLTTCADMKVGTEIIRGISGGERKRTNIGMELIVSPSFLFLDEPTTGLDASTANAVMLLLHRLGRKGKTIIFSIHQPRYSIFKLFDRLTLLSMGHMVYHGPCEDALEYFSSIGYECEAHNNPPDFFLDIINGDSTAVKSIESNEANGTVVNNEHVSIQFENKEEESNIAVKLNQNYKSSHHYKTLHKEVDPILHALNQASNDDVDTIEAGYATGFFTQLNYVSKRAVLNIVRNPETSIMQVIVMMVFGVLVGLIYYDLENGYKVGIQNRVGAFFFIIMNQVFGNLSAVELFIKERVIFIHENSNGFYRVSAYFISKVFCDIVPLRLIPTFVFCAIVYFMIGLQIDAAKFFFFTFTLFSVGICAASLGFMFSATVSVFAIANLLIALCYVFMMVFSGMLINVQSILSWLEWIKWFSIFRYALNALNINEMEGESYCTTAMNVTKCDTGNEYMDIQGIPYGTNWDLWSNIVALWGFTILFLIITYIQLRRMKKFK